jgi:hypothetical protein
MQNIVLVALIVVLGVWIFSNRSDFQHECERAGGHEARLHRSMLCLSPSGGILNTQTW